MAMNFLRHLGPQTGENLTSVEACRKECSQTCRKLYKQVRKIQSWWKKSTKIQRW